MLSSSSPSLAQAKAVAPPFGEKVRTPEVEHRRPLLRKFRRSPRDGTFLPVGSDLKPMDITYDIVCWLTAHSSIGWVSLAEVVHMAAQSAMTSSDIYTCIDDWVALQILVRSEDQTRVRLHHGLPQGVVGASPLPSGCALLLGLGGLPVL